MLVPKKWLINPLLYASDGRLLFSVENIFSYTPSVESKTHWPIIILHTLHIYIYIHSISLVSEHAHSL